MNTSHSGSTKDHHLDSERSLALRRAAKASFIGNFIEWFDYASYGYLVTVIGHAFFPEADKSVQLLSTYAVFAMSFILRPIGAVVWGAWGDRWGRRWALSWSILIMSGSTFFIGLLPTYAAIGMASAMSLLVLRMIQGFSASGEYAGAGTFLAEYAPPARRGIYTSLVPASTACGLLAGSLMVTGMFSVLSEDAMNTWGWRVPFLLAGPLGLIGRYIRVHLEDSPAYQEMRAEMPQEQKTASWVEPLRLLLRDHLRETLITFGVSCLNAVAFYMLLTYMRILAGHLHSGNVCDAGRVHRRDFSYGAPVGLLRTSADAHRRLCRVHRSHHPVVCCHDKGRRHACSGHPVPDRLCCSSDG